MSHPALWERRFETLTFNQLEDVIPEVAVFADEPPLASISVVLDLAATMAEKFNYRVMSVDFGSFASPAIFIFERSPDPKSDEQVEK